MTLDGTERAAAVADLRRRLASMGGLAGSPAAPPRARPAPAVVPMADRLPPGFESEQTSAGPVWVRRAGVDLAPFLERSGAGQPASAGELLRLTARLPPDLPLAGWADGEVAVLDIESLGLRGSGVVAFLIGVGVPRGTRLEVDQLLLADPGEERALLLALLTRLESCRVLVTYNGRTFDLPVLRSRCVVNRIEVTALEGRLHCDVLAVVRRLFRDRLGACSLRRAELGLLGLDRVDDVPGEEAPARYRAWLRGAPFAVLDGVVRHNQLDLCSTMVVAARLVAHVAGRLVEPVHPADHYRLAVHLERCGVQDGVEPHLRDAFAAAQRPWDREAGHRLALRLRRERPRRDEAVAIWSALLRRDPGDLRSARALAIALERGGRHPEALAITEEMSRRLAALPAWRRERLTGAPAAGWEGDWQRRRTRLARRCAGAGAPELPLAGHDAA
jgi:uncharacterized protein YprB with RNaseH-like and TPR domain